MFKDGYAIATRFTYPIIISERNVAGECSSTIGAFVPVNKDGWIVTAGHVLEHMIAVQISAETCQKRERDEAAIRADKTLDEKTRRARLRGVGKGKPQDVDRWSALWGALPGNPQLKDYCIVKAVDLGVARLDPFDAAGIAQYPVFKDPSKNFEPGVSLCKLGYPFHSFEPTYDEAENRFDLPVGALPAPFFPIDGIFTRITRLVDEIGKEPDSPHLLVETSTPGLRGQSGGPTFDNKGTVWAIQVRTSHWPLGFVSAAMPAQYFHVGLGVHPTTLFKVFDDLAVKYAVSDY